MPWSFRAVAHAVSATAMFAYCWFENSRVMNVVRLLVGQSGLSSWIARAICSASIRVMFLMISISISIFLALLVS